MEVRTVDTHTLTHVSQRAPDFRAWARKIMYQRNRFFFKRAYSNLLYWGRTVYERRYAAMCKQSETGKGVKGGGEGDGGRNSNERVHERC
jgi:hypothetical protein